jgi:hypothetical protein
MPSHQVYVAVDLHASSAQAFHEFTSFAWLERNPVLFDVQPRTLALNANVVLSFRGTSAAAHVATKVSRFVPDQQIAFHYSNSVDLLRATCLHFCFEVFGVAACRLVVVKQTAGIFYNAFDEFDAERARLLDLVMGFKQAVDARYKRLQTGFVSGSADGLVAQVAPPQWRYAANPKCHQCKHPIADTVTSVVNKTDRQTHCRACGRQFCSDCCDKRIVVPTFALSSEPQKVCSNCFRDLFDDLEPPNEADKAENLALIEAMRREVEAQVVAQSANDNNVPAPPPAALWSQTAYNYDDDDDEDTATDGENDGKRPAVTSAPRATVAPAAAPSPSGSRWRETNLFTTDESDDQIAVMVGAADRETGLRDEAGAADDVIATLLAKQQSK